MQTKTKIVNASDEKDVLKHLKFPIALRDKLSVCG
jgi:hypothetical protein